MSVVTITSVIAPEIAQFFNSILLSMPAPKFRDTCEDLWRIYMWIKTKLIKKAANNPTRLNKCLELEKQFLELYERAKAKEKEREGQKEHRTQEPFYRFRETGRNHRWVFSGLRMRSYRLPFSLYREDDAIQSVQGDS